MGLLDEFRTIIRMVGRGVVRGFGGGAQPVNRRDLSRAERKAAGKDFTGQQRKEDAVGCGVFVLLLALLLGLFALQARGSDGSEKKIVLLSADDPTTLSKSLFSGPPVLLECTTDSPSTPLGALVDAELLPSGVQAARIDCSRPLPSGRTMLQRFFGSKGGSAAAPPLLLAVGGQPPRVIDRKHKGKPTDLAVVVRQLSKATVHAVSRTRELHRCARLSVCVLLVTSGGGSKARAPAPAAAAPPPAARTPPLTRPPPHRRSARRSRAWRASSAPSASPPSTGRRTSRPLRRSCRRPTGPSSSRCGCARARARRPPRRRARSRAS